jgi:hypothetical protein
MVPRLNFPGWSAFEHPSQDALAAMLTVYGRLAEVEAAFDRLLEVEGVMGPQGNVDGQPYDSLLARSLYCFGVVTYMRCFTTGKRPTLRIEDVEGVTRRQLQLHASMRQLRNQHLAHAVCEEEAAHIYLVHSERHGRIASFHVLNAVLSSGGVGEARRMVSLVRMVRKHVQRRICKLGDDVAKDFFGPTATWRKLSSWPPLSSRTTNPSRRNDA